MNAPDAEGICPVGGIIGYGIIIIIHPAVDQRLIQQDGRISGVVAPPGDIG